MVSWNEMIILIVNSQNMNPGIALEIFNNQEEINHSTDDCSLRILLNLKNCQLFS